MTFSKIVSFYDIEGKKHSILVHYINGAIDNNDFLLYLKIKNCK